MLASDIINRAADFLKDANHDRWTDAMLLRNIGDAQRVIVEMRPSANVSHATITLTAGTLQDIPGAAYRLLDVIRNNTGGKPGRAVSYCSRELMDQADPNWHTAKAERVVRQWLSEPRDPRKWYAYPPVSVAGGAPSVEALVSTIPAAPIADTDALALADDYEDAVLAYTMYLCYSLEADYANHGQAQTWLSAFGRVMQGKPLFELKAGPKGQDQGAATDPADKMGGV